MMQGPERATPPTAARFETSLGARVVGRPATIVSRFGDAVWSVLHVLGAHRWRDGYEADLERGWSRYRGSRCTVCDAPWEGW
jgi:hypothetical protein